MLFFPPNLAKTANAQWLNAEQRRGQRARGISIREYTGSTLQWSTAVAWSNSITKKGM